jgi:hypothetical protein
MQMGIEDCRFRIPNKIDLFKCLASADWVKLKMVCHSIVGSAIRVISLPASAWPLGGLAYARV